MSRWRPATPASSPYITPEGYAYLEKENAELWEKRKEVTVAITAAAAEGDRSENAEYIYRKKQLREIDKRIGYLQRRLPKLNIVKEVQSSDHIFFGAWINLEDEEGKEYNYRIVGADEFDNNDAYISIDSPLARALIKKQVDDEVIIETAKGKKQYYVIDIQY
ncbi:MAG: transcription elongation factor GreB [Pseudomonadota bacterium]